MIWNQKARIVNFLSESEMGEPSIARTAHKAAALVERLTESKEPKKELKKWIEEQHQL